MTREEAIELLEDLDGTIEDNHGRDYDEAFRMAIESLSAEWVAEKEREFEELNRPFVNSNSAKEQIAETEQKSNRPKGEWLDVEHEPYCECSVCGAYIENLDDDFAFCPRCGADMRPEK